MLIHTMHIWAVHLFQCLYEAGQSNRPSGRRFNSHHVLHQQSLGHQLVQLLSMSSTLRDTSPVISLLCSLLVLQVFFLLDCPQLLLEATSNILCCMVGFAKHPWSRYFALNPEMRHRALQTGRIYVRQHPHNAHLTVDDLRDIVGREGEVLSNRVLHFACSLRGTRQYYFKQRSQLIALVDTLSTSCVLYKPF